MKKLISIAVISCYVLGLFAQNGNTVNIIPQPVFCKVQAGNFTVTPATKIVFDKDDAQMKQAGAVFNELFATAAGFSLPVNTGKAGNNTLYCVINPKLSNDEAYKLSVTSNRIRIEARTPCGIFYALQTLRQLLPPQIESSKKVTDVSWTIPCVEINDAPSFPYRGLHLDVVRHFFDKEEVMRYIDLLAFHKMNKFHWHLTDDQGWRIEIKKYPKLTETGAFRNRTLKGSHRVAPELRQWDNTRYGGFYTQEDVKEVIAYAQKRFVTIIPEIEMPGHSVAALTSYPNLSCSGGPFEVESKWGIFNDIYCTRDEIFTFLEGVLDEVCELFPSEYIHIGGDEAPKVRWERCAACQERMKKEGLKDEHELQSYFIKRIAKYLASKDRKIIGWDEILDGGLVSGATVMSWRGTKGGIAAAKLGHSVIMTPYSHLYLDYYQGDPATEPLAIGGNIPLEKTYSYDPIPEELTPDEAKHILGVQGNVWAEFIPVFDHVLYMAYPRAAAVAELGWTPKNKRNYDSFLSRLIPVLKHYDVMGVNYSKSSVGACKLY